MSPPLEGPLAGVAATLLYFAVSGVHVTIRSGASPRSGLGGSAVVLVCVIAAVNRALVLLGRSRHLPGREIAFLARDLEQAVSTVRGGLQDQLAAVYGGAHLWIWCHAGAGHGFERRRIGDRRLWRYLAEHLLVAETCEHHDRSGLTERYLEDFLRGRGRAVWPGTAKATVQLAGALERGNWTRAARALNVECDLRVRAWPSVLTPTGHALVRAARAEGCGARFCGGGEGGAVYALGPTRAIRRVESRWKELLEGTEAGHVLRPGVAERGLSVGVSGTVVSCS